MNERAHRITLDKERSMYFPNYIMKQMLDSYGDAKAIYGKIEAMGRDGGIGFNSADLDAFLDLMAWGFKHESPDMTGKKLYEITDIGHLPALGQVFGLAFSGSLPKAKEDSSNPQKAKKFLGLI